MSGPEAPAFAPSEPPKTRWNRDLERKAEALKPTLHRWQRKPVRVVDFQKDDAAYFGLQATPAATSMQQFGEQTWGKGADIVLDFGIHMVGYLSMRLDAHGKHMDAPCRLRLTFGESPLDVTMGMDNVKTWISTAWLPDEVINIDMCPETLRLPRRYAFRYLRIEVIDTSHGYQVSFSDIHCECVSAINQTHQVDMFAYNDPILRSIDHVSLMTLRDCMQTVFEDGPRRDRRLWLGDLRLQALVNYKTLKDFDLVKRCIYMFAAIIREDDSVPACLFEQPRFTPSEDYIVDYDALFSAVVLDYVEASGDVSFGLELWDAVLGCLKRALAHVNPETGVFEESRADGWKFLDWQPKLHRQAGEHGLLIYCLKATNRLATLIKKEPPHEEMVLKMTQAASVFLSEDGLLISGADRQVSYASASWLSLSGAFPAETARAALLKALNHPDAVKPLTPYAWHYVCDALATVGCEDKCIEIIKSYWGKMIEAGADTFWEFFDPDDRMGSPYGDVRNNSFCHAWSCTPSFLLRGKLWDIVGKEGSSKSVSMHELDEAWIQQKQDAASLKIC